MLEGLYEQHRRVTEWQAAFVQGVAASAIAFAIHETADRTPTLSLGITAGALLLWGASFACGIWSNHAKQRAIAANIADVVALQHKQTEQAAKSVKAFARHSKRSSAFYVAQLWLLLAGALTYGAGHGVHIWENGKQAAPQQSAQGSKGLGPRGEEQASSRQVTQNAAAVQQVTRQDRSPDKLRHAQ